MSQSLFLYRCVLYKQHESPAYTSLTPRSGSMWAKDEEEVLARLEHTAIHIWKRALTRINIHFIDNQGEQIEVTTVPQRVEVIRATHQALKTGRFANVKPKNSTNKKGDSSVEREKSLTVPPTTSKLTEWTWTASVGTAGKNLYESFAIYKFEEQGK